MTTTVYVDDNDEFRCSCGNYPNAEGAYACDTQGRDLNDNLPDWDHLWCCDRCGIIFAMPPEHRGACQIVGQRNKVGR